MNRSHLLNLAATAAAVAVGVTTTNPILATVVGGIGVNWAAELLPAGGELVRQRWLSGQAVLNHDIAVAFGRALRRVLDADTLAKEYRGTGYYGHLRRTAPAKADECDAAMEVLAGDLRAFFRDPVAALAVGTAAEAGAAELLFASPEGARAALKRHLAEYLHGHDADLLQFVQKRLDPEALAFYFTEELKDPGEAGTRAWRAYQKLMHESLRAALDEVTRDVKEIRAVTESLANPTVMDHLFQRALDERHAELKVLLEQVKEHVSTEASRTREEMSRGFGEMEGRFEGLPADIAAALEALLRQREAERARPPTHRRIVNAAVRVKPAAFHDRVGETLWLRQRLGEPGVRLILVVGRGGYGKSALVYHLLEDAEDGTLRLPQRDQRVRGIAYFHAVETGITLDRLYRDLGELLGEPYRAALATFWKDPGATLRQKATFLLEQAMHACAEGELLLVCLDNLESALDDQGQVADEGARLWLEACLRSGGPVRLLATSRDPGRMPGAGNAVRRYPLEHGLPLDEAVTLLRALDPDGSAGLRDAGEELLQAVAQRTVGIPFALEKVAGLLQDAAPTLTLPRLLADEALFSGEVSQALAEHSYSHLDVANQRVMTALAVFGRPVPAVAVAFVLADDLTLAQAEQMLARLARGYFVSYRQEDATWALHPQDAQVAAARLDEGDRAAWHRRAADYYARLHPPQAQWRALADLQSHLHRFEHLVAAGDYDPAARLVSEIDLDYLLRWGHAELVRSLREPLVDQLADRWLASVNLGNLGLAYADLGQVQEAINYDERALSISREIGDRRGEGSHLGNLGLAHYRLGQVQKAIDYYEDALSILQAIGDRRGEGNHLGSLGLAYYRLGELQTAIDYYEQALAISREIDDRRGEGNHLGNLGLAYAALGQVREAIEYYEQALSILQAIGDRRGEGNHLGNLGNAYHRLGQVQEALGYCEEALSIGRAIGDRRGEGNRLGSLGLAYAALGQVQKAIGYYEQALTISRAIEDRHGEGSHLGNLGLAYYRLGELQTAIGYYEQALTISRAIEDRLGEGNHLSNLGRAFAATGDSEQAIDNSNQSLRIKRETGDRSGEGEALNHLGYAYFMTGAVDQAIHLYQTGIVLLRDVGYQQPLACALTDLAEAYLVQEALTEANEAGQEALAIAKRIGDRYAEAQALQKLGHVAHGRHAPDEARQHWEAALAILEEMHSSSAEQVRGWLEELEA